jgi:hypothetical protein
VKRWLSRWVALYAPPDLTPEIAFGAAVAVACALVASMCGGCATSSIRLHAEGAAIATVAIEGAQGEYLAALDRAMGACTGDADEGDCITIARHSARPVETALDVADAAVRAWRDAIEVALLADESDALLSALVTAGLRVLARWQDVRAVAAPYGIDLPALSLAGLGGE